MVSTRVSLEVLGLAKLADTLARFTPELVQTSYNQVRDLGERYTRALRVEAPERTGKLKWSIKYEISQTGMLTTLLIGIDLKQVPYADWVRLGRGPVVAIRAKALRFQLTRGGPFIFRKRVGPSKPNRFDLRAAARMSNEPWGTADRIAYLVSRG